MSGVASVRLWAAWALLVALVGARPARAEGGLPGKTLSTRLPNGLEVVLSEAREQPIFSMMVRYRVGGRHDPSNLDELSHLVEHLSFRFSEHAGKKQFLALIGAGVTANAYTEDDATSFVGRELFAPGHPYAPRDERGCIQRCELRHVQWLMQRGYRPDNARLVVVGDFDAEALLKQVTRLFGSIENPEVKLPAATPPPLGAGGRRVTIAAPVRRSRLHLYWALPEALRSERVALAVLAAELERRFSRDLVDQMLLATDVTVKLEHGDLAWLWSVDVELLPGIDPKQVEQRVLALLAQFRTKLMPIESGRQASTAALFSSWDAPGSRVGLLAEMHLGFDPAKTAAELSRVSSRDVQRVARQFLIERPRLAVHVRRAVDADHRGELYREPP